MAQENAANASNLETHALMEIVGQQASNLEAFAILTGTDVKTSNLEVFAVLTPIPDNRRRPVYIIG